MRRADEKEKMEDEGERRKKWENREDERGGKREHGKERL